MPRAYDLREENRERKLATYSVCDVRTDRPSWCLPVRVRNTSARTYIRRSAPVNGGDGWAICTHCKWLGLEGGIPVGCIPAAHDTNNATTCNGLCLHGTLRGCAEEHQACARTHAHAHSSQTDRLAPDGVEDQSCRRARPLLPHLAFLITSHVIIVSDITSAPSDRSAREQLTSCRGDGSRGLRAEVIHYSPASWKIPCRGSRKFMHAHAHQTCIPTYN